MSEVPNDALHEPADGVARHAAAVALAANTEFAGSEKVSPELPEKIGEYFDNRITTPYIVRTEEAARDLQRYKDTFTETAVEVFGSRATDASGEYNPRLSELASILTSVDHNADVYYGKDDVIGIFRAVAHEIFDDPETKQQLAGDTVRPHAVIQTRAAEVTSVDREVSLPLVKDESGVWRVANNKEYGNTKDFKPLEVLRQDNADKRGYGKYRFRQPTYTRTPDALHAKKVANEWYTSEWYQDPNYWSAQVRGALAATAATANMELADIDASVMFVTEGGVFKGTATEGTDMDTSCWVSCNSPADFAEAHERITRQLADCLDSIPFDTKRGSGLEITPSLFDRSTGQQYHRNDNGEFKVLKSVNVIDDNFVTRVRQHEKGVMVTTAEGMTLFRKPKTHDNKNDVYISITPSGAVQQIVEPIVPPRTFAVNTDT